ncbi:type II secretion system F family protein [Microcella sp.]|uniref:type II secretion system F family protein n=1 Tax=Microcella sp. TaxID=1913979 RepID=UPI003F7208EA
MTRPGPSPGEGALASQLHRLAVLIAAGVGPRAAWMHTAASAGDPTLTRVAMAIERGDDIGAAIAAAGGVGAAMGSSSTVVADVHRPLAEADAAWRSLAAAWRVATTSGAPLAPALRGFAEGLRDREAARRDIRIALAGPRATARIVMVLPAIAVLLGLLMGVDLVSTWTSPVGAGALTGGLVLVVVARRWMRHLLNAAAPPPPTVGLALDLLAVAAGGGGSPEAAAALVEAELSRVGLVGAGEAADGLALASLVARTRPRLAPPRGPRRARRRSGWRCGSCCRSARASCPPSFCSASCPC